MEYNIITNKSYLVNVVTKQAYLMRDLGGNSDKHRLDLKNRI